MKRSIIFFTFFIVTAYCFAQMSLKRQADWGARLVSMHPAKPGMEVRSIRQGSPASLAGLNEKDIIIKMDDVQLSDPYIAGKTLRKYREGDQVSIEALRSGVLYKFRVQLKASPLEEYPDINVTYASVITEKGHHLRTIFTKPKSDKRKLPVILITQWLSCDQVEINTKKVSIYDSLLFEVITNSGFACMRVEKPGLGDSEGPDCTDCDYGSELAGYKAAFKALKQMEDIDTSSIYILGISIGASSAPLVFQNEDIKGIIVTGGFSKTWFEHMLELERQRLLLTGIQPGEKTELIKKYIEFYNDYLNHKKTPAEVIKAKPHLQGIWYEGDAHQYERPASYYHQLQEKNVAAAWQNVKCPVLVIYGEYDWIMSRDDHQQIAAIVNARQAGLAKYVEIPKMGHSITLHSSMQEAFSGANAKYASEVFKIIMNWLKVGN